MKDMPVLEKIFFCLTKLNRNGFEGNIEANDGIHTT